MVTWSLFIAAASALAAPNLVLISMDTTRADAVSCYGTVPGMVADLPPVTPRIDAIAAEGVRLEHFYANAPTTLSSHTTMFTGLDPHGHAVVRNGFPIDPEIDTLTQRLQGAGYDTIAVLGSAALESAMGLDRGFSVYDDDVDELVGFVYQDRAENVIDRTLGHLDARESDKPLFLFVHLYDAHTPYEAPEPYRERFTDPAYVGIWRDASLKYKPLVTQIKEGTADPADVQFVAGRYAGEVGYADAQIGRLVDELERRRLLEDTLLVITADHGENLTDFPFFAYSHGSDVGYGAMHIPLVIRGYGVPVAERAVVKRQASLSGLAATLERAVGLSPTLPGHGFWDLIRPGPVWDEDGWPERATRPAFLEATRPRSLEPETGWNNRFYFRGIWSGGWGAFGAPIYDLDYDFYDQVTDPQPAILPTLKAQMAAWDADLPDRQEADQAPATERALRALGYLEDD